MRFRVLHSPNYKLQREFDVIEEVLVCFFEKLLGQLQTDDASTTLNRFLAQENDSTMHNGQKDYLFSHGSNSCCHNMTLLHLAASLGYTRYFIRAY